MNTEPVSVGVRTVLDAPRGRRFSPTRTGPTTREQRLLAQMEGNPRVAYRQAHGTLPLWMHLQAARMAERDHRSPRVSEGPWKPSPDPAPQRPAQPMIPRPRTAPDDGPPPPARPPLPRRPRRPHSHRKPRPRRSRVAWHLCGYTLATLAGALAHHLTTGLF